MSRGEDVNLSSRQNSRYLQLSESVKVNKANKRKGFNERKTQSQKAHSNNVGVSKQLSLQDFVKVSPSYTSNIEHLVFQDGKSAPSKSSKQNILTNLAPKLSRSRIAEVFALNRYQTSSSSKDKKEKKGWAENVGGVGGVGHQHRTVPDPSTREPASSELYRLGASANVDLVHAAVLNFKSLRKSGRPTVNTFDDEMASTRGQNVSILHLRGPKEPWEPPITTFADSGGSLRSAPKINSVRGGSGTVPSLKFSNEGPVRQQSLGNQVSGTLPSNYRKRDTNSSNSVSLLIASGVGSSATLNSSGRELSPVRWCDREVDGVYLGRSGWVQVQQRSLDDNRRSVITNKMVVANSVTSTLPTRIKLADYHCNSEPGQFSDGKKERPRPDYLPLPIEMPRNRENHTTPSPFAQEYESVSPPPITPIISPPPAFQDPGTGGKFQMPPRPRTLTGKPPFLPRSKAVVDCESPPKSPPPANWTYRNAVTPTLSNRSRRLTPSPASTPQQHHVPHMPQTKSLEDNSSTGVRRSQFQTYNESSSSSSSSFGFRSLDNSISRSSAMPRVNETDSSVEGYDDEGDEEDRRTHVRMKTPPPESFHDRLNGERVSPNNLRHRNSQRSLTGRRIPSSETGSLKKYNKRLDSSSSDSSLSPDRKSPNTTFRRFNQRQNRQVAENQSNTWDNRNSRVRRSRSLQLPEKRSPIAQVVATPSSSGGSREHLSPDYPFFNSKNGAASNAQYAQNSGHRVVLKVNGENVSTLDRPRRMGKKTQSEDSKYEEMRREAEEEARIVTEFLNSTRSRAAARDLLMHRYLNRPEEPNQRMSPIGRERDIQPETYNVYFVGSGSNNGVVNGSSNSGGSTNSSRRSSQKKTLQRGATTPTPSQGYCTASPSNPNPCNPSICDFWPHCAHRDSMVYSKPSTPTPPKKASSPSSHNSNMKLSQSYPTAVNQNQRRPEKSTRRDETRQVKESKTSSTRSSPASLESMSECEPRKEYRKANNSTRSSPASLDRVSLNKRHVVSPNQEQKIKKPQRQNSEKIRSKFENVDIDGYVSVSRKVPNLDDQNRYVRNGNKIPLEENDYKDRKGSPIYQSVSYDNNSSNSSSSSDIWLTTSDRTATKSPKAQKSSEASTPMDDYISTNSKSPMRDRDTKRSREVFSPRPGSAPTNDVDDRIALDAQQRSLSLPKSFLSDRYGFRNSKQSGLFPWRRQMVGMTNAANTGSGLRPLTPEVSRTAPATPVRDLGSGAREKERSKQQQYNWSSSTPLLDEPSNINSEWDVRRELSQSTEDGTKDLISRNNSVPYHKEIIAQRSISANPPSESVLQKFRKSFSLRFHRTNKGTMKDDSEEAEELPEDVNEDEALHLQQKNNFQNIKEDNNNTDQKFRFGPLVWRSSKERKKGKKAARNAKCNSGDSGIQIENSVNIAGDSSESHDTDQQDDMDSPPVVRRRPTSNEKTSRPQSEVINQILIDKFKADLQWRAQSRGYPNRKVRRTNSDLGGQRLFNWEVRNNYRRMISTPSPIKNRPQRMSPRKPSPEGPVVLRNNKRLPGRAQLRRSMSQPLGLNELSPLMRRKPSTGKNQILSEDEHEGRGNTSEDEAMSDSESSVASLTDRKKSFEQAMDEEVVVLAEAVWDHVAMEPEELAFRAGDVVEVLDTLDRDWWWGSTGENCGWFPSAFVRLRVSQEDTVEDCLAAMASGSQTATQLRRRTSISLLSNDQVRSSVVRELLNTERDFVKVLRDVTEGYIAECRRRTDMFTQPQIDTIFGNLENLLAFQTDFLDDLEARVDRDAPHRSCVGEIFLRHRAGFRMYSEYCNSHPMAIATLQELYQRNSYSKFFEACRLMRGLIEIPLDGYLLTPVQRICKYPLQLAELLKYTKPDHPDYQKVREALEAMRGVAMLINERKRRMESLEKLAAWQHRVEGWEGEDLIEISSQLIHQGEAVRVTSGMWTSNITMFLFDHQLIYCKKDLLKRNTYVYKGRICLDTSEIIDIPDGKDPQSGVTIRHGLKIYSCVRDKWLFFCCRNAEEKMKWLEALAEERRLVAQDRQDGLELPPAARQLARMAARSKRRPPSKPRSKNYKRDPQYNAYPAAKVGRKVGTWFTFGGGKKGGRVSLRAGSTPQHVT